MPTVTLKAHFDGERIRLDEPYELPANASLLVTLLMPQLDDEDRAAWIGAGRRALARAFGDSEPEYTLEDIRR